MRVDSHLETSSQEEILDGPSQGGFGHDKCKRKKSALNKVYSVHIFLQKNISDDP